MDELIKFLKSISEYFEGNKVSILTNLVASLIFFLAGLLLGSYSKVIDSFRRRQMRTIWKCRDRIYIFSSSQRLADNDQVILRSGDFHAIIEISNFIRQWFTGTEIVLCDAINTQNFDFVYNNDLVLIGGPHNNYLTAYIFNELEKKNELRAKFDTYSIVSQTLNTRYSLEKSSSGTITTDFAMIYSLPNPFDKKHHITIIAGCKSYGTLACAKTLLRKEFYKEIDSHMSLGTLCAIIKCEVANDRLTLFQIIEYL